MSRERIDSIERRIDSDVLTITTTEGTRAFLSLTDPDVQAFMREREHLHPAAPTSWYLDVRLVDGASAVPPETPKEGS